MDNATYSIELRRYLRRLLLRTAALHAGSGLVSFIATGAWVLLALVVWTAAVAEPSLTAAHVMTRGAIIILAGLFLYFVVWPIARMPGLDRLAAEVERRKDLKELVRAGFEFSRDDSASRRYAPDLVREVIRQAVERVSGLEVRYLFLTRKDLALMPVAYGALAVLLVLSLADPDVLLDAGRRVASPASVAARDHRANIQATPGDVTVLAGNDVTVAGLDLGQTQRPVTIGYNLAEDFWKTEPTKKIEPAVGTPGEAAFNRYEYTFNDLRHTVSYYFESGDYKSRTYTITVVHKPLLTDLAISLTPPAYTGEAPSTLEDSGGNVQALEGTKVRIEGTSNNPLAGAWVQFDQKARRPIEFADRKVNFGFRALKDGRYSVLLQDTLGYKTDDPLVYSIEVFKDHPPSLEVIQPGTDAVMPRTQKLTLGFVASDDYGVSSAAVYYRRGGKTEFQRVPIALDKQKNHKDIAVAYPWDLTSIDLFPGNYIEYYVQVADNNTVTGPGVTRSRLFQITVPTMAELYKNVQDEESQRSDMFEQAIKDSKEFRQQLEKITREYIKTEKMEWSQKKEIDKAVEKQKSVEDKLNDIKNSLDQTMQQLADNQMTSQQIGEKIEEIRQLMNEIDSEALRKHIEALRKAVEKMSPEDIKKALQNMQLSSDEMLKKLERTADLLKQLKKEQQMEEVVRKSQSLMNEQKELNDQTADSKASDADKMQELAKKQSDLAKKADDLAKSVDRAAKEAEDKQVAQEMQQMSSQLDSQNDGPQKNMRKASSQLRQQQQQGAMQQQQQAMDKLISLFQRAQHAQMQMQSMQGRQMAANFQKYARETLDLSFRQEKLAGELTSQKETNENADTDWMAKDQMSYLRATRKVADEITKLSGMSLQVSPALMKALGAAIDQMQNAVLFLAQNKSFMSTAYANNAVKSLNQATIEMLRSAKQCSQGGAGSGSNAQQLLEQLIPSQQEVLQQTQSLMQMQALSESMRQQRENQLQRLAGQQRSLADVAKEIQQSMRNNRDLLGRLDRTVKDMESVTQSLQKGEVNDEVVNKEQRILSRMLDAQRSIHTRDYEKKRESITAADIYSKSLGANPNAPASQTLREEIRRAMQLKAPGEFEELIKLYFRALAEESNTGAAGGGNVEKN